LKKHEYNLKNAGILPGVKINDDRPKVVQKLIPKDEGIKSLFTAWPNATRTTKSTKPLAKPKRKVKKPAKSFQEALPREDELDEYGLAQLLDVQDQLERMKINRSLNRQAEVSSTDEERWTNQKKMPKIVEQPRIVVKQKEKPAKKVMFSQELIQHETNSGSGSSESQEYTNYLLKNKKRRVDLQFEK
jgi:hypothetical protein